MLTLLVFYVGFLCWTILPDFIRLNLIIHILRRIFELVGCCNFALHYVLKGIKAILEHCLKGVEAVMPSARGRRVRIADEVSSSFMAYYKVRADQILLCRRSY